MSGNKAATAIDAPLTANPLDVIPDEIPFDVPYGRAISLYQAEAVIHAAVAEARKMNIAVADSRKVIQATWKMFCVPR